MNLKEKIDMFKQSRLKNINLIYELTSCCMEMPFVDVKGLKYKKMVENLVEKCRVAYAEGSDNIYEAMALLTGFEGKYTSIKDYVIELNIYLNSLCTVAFIMDNYINNYFERFGETNEINTIFTYSQIITQYTNKFTDNFPKYVLNLGEEYYV